MYAISTGLKMLPFLRVSIHWSYKQKRQPAKYLVKSLNMV
jgi:hypothetical protein